MATGVWTDAADTQLETTLNGCYVLSNTVNMTNAIASAVPSITGAAADVLNCLTIPADTVVLQVAIEVTTVSAISSSTLDVGDGSGPDSWIQAVDANALATSIGDGAYAQAAGKSYASADTIDVKIKVASAVVPLLIFKIWAVCVPLN